MKLLQLNIWNGRLGHELRDLLEAEQPDIVCFQEAVSIPGGKVGLFMSVEDLTERLGMKLAVGALWDFQIMGRKAYYGNVIGAKLELSSQNTIFTNLDYISDFDFNRDDWNRRNFLHAIIDTPQGPLNVITHHGLFVAEDKHGNEATDRQCRQIADYIAGLTGPVVLTGDFNLEPSSHSLVPLDELLINLCVKHQLTTTRNELTIQTAVCDYIWVSPDLDVKNFKMATKLASDHNALIIEF